MRGAERGPGAADRRGRAHTATQTVHRRETRERERRPVRSEIDTCRERDPQSQVASTKTIHCAVRPRTMDEKTRKCHRPQLMLHTRLTAELTRRSRRPAIVCERRASPAPGSHRLSLISRRIHWVPHHLSLISSHLVPSAIFQVVSALARCHGACRPRAVSSRAEQQQRSSFSRLSIDRHRRTAWAPSERGAA